MPSSSRTPRVVRKYDSAEIFADSELRHRALDQLLDDFDDRCAYSMVHVATISRHDMEVDHHNPTLTKRKRNVYKNLYPSCSICNNHKRARWPDKAQQRKGLRFLDPCREMDYNEQLFEDPVTGELLPTTRQAVYHLENCNLNYAWLKEQRRKRNAHMAVLQYLQSQGIGSKDPNLAALLSTFEKDIPAIDPLPAGASAL